MIPENRAHKPNPALQPFAKLIGTWSIEGHHPYVTDKTLIGQVTFEWIYGGAFLVVRSEIHNDPRFPNGIEIFGSDDTTKEFFMLHFDERDVSRKYDVAVEGSTIRWWRDSAEFSQHFELTIADNGNTMVSKGKMRQGTGEWESDLELRYTRIN